MAYTIDRIFEGTPFDAVVEQTRTALDSEGFGILTEIDVKATIKKKLNVDMDDYKILGACNPRMAHQAIELEPRVGAMLPCNVIVRTTGWNAVEVSVVDPVASMSAIDNEDLRSVAGEVRGLLAKVVEKI
jgi:uncharacterized protein (DUF302 family)